MAIDYETIGREARERFKVTYYKACESWGFFFDKFWGTSDLVELEKVLDGVHQNFTVSVTRQMMRNEKLSWRQIEIMSGIYARKCGPEGSKSYGVGHDYFYDKVNKFYT